MPDRDSADGDHQASDDADPIARLTTGPRIAIVHDFLYTYGGAERVLEEMLHVYPHADLFSLFDFVPEADRGFLGGRPVTTSFIQRLPKARTHHRHYLPLMPLAVEQLDVSDYDIVLSSSYVAAKGVLTRPDQLHVCYCHSPVRFAWDLQHQYLREQGLTRGIKSMMARMILHYLRTWDTRTANGVDVFLSNSDFVGRRIRRVYRRESTTVYPPVDLNKFTPGEEKADFYFTASRLVPYKKVDLIAEAFAKMPERRLIIAGDGPMMDRVREKAGPNVRIVGYQSDEDLLRYMRLARAFVFAAEEDFGIVPVEAQACGTPVIAFGRGGAAETVVAGETGVFFEEQTPESLIEAVERFEAHGEWDPAEIRRHVERFSPGRFHEELAAAVDRAVMEAAHERAIGDLERVEACPAPGGVGGMAERFRIDDGDDRDDAGGEWSGEATDEGSGESPVTSPVHGDHQRDGE